MGTLLRRTTAFQTQYDRDAQTLSSNLNALDRARINTQLPVFEANNQRLKDAIDSLKSVPVQLQQQRTTAHEALLKMLRDEYINDQQLMALAKDPNLSVNERGLFESTALHIAARKGYRDVVELLLRRGAQVSITTNDGLTALHFVTSNGHGEAAILLRNAQ